jgi:hypothetical protein
MKAEIEQKFQSLGGIVPIGDTFVTVGEEELCSLENALHVKLPEYYRIFLMTYGASTFTEYVDFQPIQSLPLPASDTGKGHISSFYGASRDPYMSLEKAIAAFYDRIPVALIPIGDDSGNKICLGIQGDEYGKIFYWGYQTEIDDEDYLEEHGTPLPKELKYQNVYLIADSFEDFIRRLEKSDRG